VTSTRVAVGQVPGSPDKDANLAIIADQIATAAASRATLIAFPEYAMYKQPVRDDGFLHAAEPLEGPFTTRIRELAAAHGIAIAIGIQERIPDEDRAFNTLLLVDAGGRDVGAYRKLHLYDAFGGTESTWVRPGTLDQPLVFDLGGFRTGTMTCYDLRFPEMARILVDQGAEVLLIPAAWTPGPRKEDHWQTMVRARAIENVAYVVAPGMAPPIGTGGSLIVDPMGVVLAELGEETAVAIADVSHERLAAVRAKNPALQHRRFATPAEPR
jgi:predicted amidohydrolase